MKAALQFITCSNSDLQYVSEYSTSPHIRVEAHTLSVGYLRGGEFSSGGRNFHRNVRVEFGGETKVNYLDVSALTRLTDHVLRLNRIRLRVT